MVRDVTSTTRLWWRASGEVLVPHSASLCFLHEYCRAMAKLGRRGRVPVGLSAADAL